jgi:aminopeptidase N
VRRLVLIALLLATFSCQKKYPLPDKGVSLALNDFRKSSISDIVYTLWFDIPEGKSAAIEAKTTIEFNLSNITQPLVLDFNVDSARIGSVTSGDEEIAYEHKNEHIIINPEYLHNGKNSISIEFTAGDQSLNRNEKYLYTLFVPDRASTCFPLFDQPNLKATYALTLRTPANWKAMSNGLQENKATDNGKTVYSFGKTKPVSSYIFAFAAGEFKSTSQTLGTREMTMYYRETDSVKVKKNVDEIFSLHAKALAWLEDYTGIPYPFGKFDFALIPSFQYGGMEHPGSIFYNESSLFLDDNASVNRKMGRASLISHETAHMWFGDLVTMDWFNDVWMKEVFANFMAAKIVQPSFPEINHDLRFLLAHYPSAYSVDRTKGANPIIQPLDNLKNAGTMYGAIIYQKAPIVMRHLENMIGEDMMKESLREYLQSYAYKNAVWDDLVKIIDKRSEDDVAKWSKAWVYTAGMPVYEMRNGESVKGFSYGYFPLPASAKDDFFNAYERWRAPDLRAAMLINTWEAMLRNDGPQPGMMFNHLSRLLVVEKDPLITDLLLGYLETLWWTFLTGDQRASNQTQVDKILWTFVTQTKDKGMQSSYFRTFRSISMTNESLQKLEDLWTGKLKVPGLMLSEDDNISIAYELALKIPARQEEFLNAQIVATKNPDRVERIKFVSPALSNDENTRDAFFESLKSEKNREHETWVLEALTFLHHPLREASSEKYLLPSLELLQEIQLTGDIFFPQRWLNTTFDGHTSKAAVDIANKFVSDHPEYPKYLVNKIWQAIDMNERAASLKIL